MIITFLDKPGGGGGTSGVIVTTKTVNVSSNPQTITANTGYAWSAVTINSDNVYSSGYTDGYTSGSTDGESVGYTSGYTDGYTSGYTDASALMPVITGESYTYSEEDDFVKTISAQTGTAFSAVTVDATNKFTAGYKTAADDANSHSEELTVSANGIYNAVIQYDVRGYYKKVTVDVPSYDKVADMTGIYMDGIDIPISGVATAISNLQFIVSGGSVNLFETTLTGTGIVSSIDMMAYTEMSGGTNYLWFAYTYGVEQNVYNVPVRDGDVLGITISRVSDTHISVHLYNYSQWKSVDTPVFNIPEVEKIHLTIGEGTGSSEPQGLYFKSFERTGSPSIRCNIIPRSDGKLWDVKHDQEYPFTWYDGQGASGNTFSSLIYEWEI